MGFILFASASSFIQAATPSSGFIVGFDVDGVFKQKDEFGVIKAITNTASFITPSFSNTLAVNNQTGNYNIILSTSSSIQSTNGSKLSLDSSGSPVVKLTNGQNQLVLSDISYINLTQSSIFSINNDSNTFRIDSKTLLNSVEEIKLRVYNDSDNILIKSNLGTSFTSSNVDSLAGIIINSKNSSIGPNISNAVVIGGLNLSATQSNTVYLGNKVNINGAYTLPQTDGLSGQYLFTNGSGNLYWSSNSESQKLSDVLSLGNNTGDNNIILGTSTSLQSISSNTIISMDWGSTNSILLSTDDGILSDSYVLINKNSITIDSASISINTDNGLGIIYANDYSNSFVANSVVSKKYVDDSLSSVTTANISQVLSVDNNTQNRSLIMGTSTFIKSSNGGGRIDLDYGSLPNKVLISTDDSAQSTSYIELDNSNIEILANNFEITLSDSSISTSNGQGFKYITDYSSTFATNSLVTKRYVDVGTSSIWNRLTSTIRGTGSSNYIPFWINSGEISRTSSLYLSTNTTINTIQSSIVVGTTPYNSIINNLNNKLYVTNFGTGNVSVINTITGLVTATISVGTNPSEIIVDKSTNLVWVTNRGSNNVTYINSLTDTVVGTVSVGSLPFGIEKVGNFIYVANHGTNNVSVINTSTNLVSTTFSVITPRTFTYDSDKNNLWITGLGPDFVGRIDLNTNTITATISVGLNPYDIVYHPNNQYLYVTNYSSNNVSVINTNTLSIIATIPVGNNPDSITLDENTGYVYVSNFNSGNISIINGLTVISTISTSGNPRGLSYDFKSGKIYVSNSGLNRLQTIETISRDFGFIGLNNLSPKSYLDIDGKLTTNSLRITQGAKKGYVLTSDSGGNAAWNIPILDITSGSGLTGGGTSGSVTLAVDYSVVASKSYVDAGTTSIWNQLSVLSSDYISGITAGNGLLGGGASGFVNLDIDYSVVASKSYVDAGTTSIWNSMIYKYSIVRSFTASVIETITHNLGTDDVIIQTYNSSGIQIIPGLIEILNSNSVNIMFSQNLSGIKIIVIG